MFILLFQLSIMTNWTAIQKYSSLFQSAVDTFNYTKLIEAINGTVVTLPCNKLSIATDGTSAFTVCSADYFGKRDYEFGMPSYVYWFLLFFFVFLFFAFLYSCFKCICCRCNYTPL